MKRINKNKQHQKSKNKYQKNKELINSQNSRLN